MTSKQNHTKRGDLSYYPLKEFASSIKSLGEPAWCKYVLGELWLSVIDVEAIVAGLLHHQFKSVTAVA